MNADITGALLKLNKVWRLFEHNGKNLSKSQVKQILEYGLSKGYETVKEIPDSEIDRIINQSEII